MHIGSDLKLSRKGRIKELMSESLGRNKYTDSQSPIMSHSKPELIESGL